MKKVKKSTKLYLGKELGLSGLLVIWIHPAVIRGHTGTADAHNSDFSWQTTPFESTSQYSSFFNLKIKKASQTPLKGVFLTIVSTDKLFKTRAQRHLLQCTTRWPCIKIRASDHRTSLLHSQMLRFHSCKVRFCRFRGRSHRDTVLDSCFLHSRNSAILHISLHWVCHGCTENVLKACTPSMSRMKQPLSSLHLHNEEIRGCFYGSVRPCVLP